MKIRKSLLDQILSSFSFESEDGGILGGNASEITNYSISKGDNKDTFSIDENLFSHIVNEWAQKDIEFLGFIHSHTNPCDKVSMLDYMYMMKFIEANPNLDKLLFGIATKEKGIKFYLFKNKDFKEISVEIV